MEVKICDYCFEKNKIVICKDFFMLDRGYIVAACPKHIKACEKIVNGPVNGLEVIHEMVIKNNTNKEKVYK